MPEVQGLATTFHQSSTGESSLLVPHDSRSKGHRRDRSRSQEIKAKIGRLFRSHVD